MLTAKHLTAALSAGTLSAAALAAVVPTGAQGRIAHHGKTRLITTSSTITAAYEALASGRLTLQRTGSARTALAEMINEANTLAAAKYPYIWGGGHGEAGIASGGLAAENGTGTNAVGFDCSGAVSAVLAAGGLWPLGTDVGTDASVISELKAAGEIANGAATGAGSVTLYDRPGVHIFMRIGNRFYGTSDGAGTGGNSKGGPGWLAGRSSDAKSKAFKRYHIKASLLTATNTAALQLSVAVAASPASALSTALATGQQLSVTYATSNYGVLTASTVVPASQISASGTISAVGAGGTSFSLTEPSGTVLTFANYTGSTTALADGNVVTVTYTTATSGLVTVNDAWTITVTSAATTSPTSTTSTTGTTSGTTGTTSTSAPSSPTGGAPMIAAG